MRAVKELKAFIGSCGYRSETFQDVRGSLGGGATIQQVIQRGLKDVAAAVVFLSPDQLTFIDPLLRESDREQATWEARPNVMFEAGMAYAQAPDKTILVALRGVAMPSDLHGLDVIYFDDPQGKETLKRRLATTTAGELSTSSEPPEDAATPKRAAKLKFTDAFLTDLMDRLQDRHLGSDKVASTADVLKGIAPLHDDWKGTSSQALMTTISTRYRNDVTEDAYWWLCLEGVLVFKDILDWWDLVPVIPTWKSSVGYSRISPTGVLLLNLISAAYFGTPKLAPELPASERAEPKKPTTSKRKKRQKKVK